MLIVTERIAVCVVMSMLWFVMIVKRMRWKLIFRGEIIVRSVAKTIGGNKTKSFIMCK